MTPSAGSAILLKLKVGESSYQHNGKEVVITTKSEVYKERRLPNPGIAQWLSIEL